MCSTVMVNTKLHKAACRTRVDIDLVRDGQSFGQDDLHRSALSIWVQGGMDGVVDSRNSLRARA